jgi:uncharacterized membrane protein
MGIAASNNNHTPNRHKINSKRGTIEERESVQRRISGLLVGRFLFAWSEATHDAAELFAGLTGQRG